MLMLEAIERELSAGQAVCGSGELPGSQGAELKESDRQGIFQAGAHECS